MNIIKNKEGTKLVINVEGRLDTTTAPTLDNEIHTSIEGINELILDFKNLEYISSAGLRVLLAAQKIMTKQGSMVILNANESVNEVFAITGFSEFLTIK